MASDGTCPGHCNKRWREASGAYRAAMAVWQKAMAARSPGDPEPGHPDEPDVRPVYGAPVWCPKCTYQIRHDLADLEDVAALVLRYADGHRGSTDAGSRVSGSKEAPSPSPALDAIDELASVLRGWESALRGRDTFGRRGLLATEVTTSVAWHLLHFDAMMASPDLAPDFGAEILQWNYQLRQRSRTGTGRTPKPMPCSRCHHRSLSQEDGAQYVECSRKAECGRLMTLSEYEAEEEDWRRSRKLARAS